jgi:dimethylglycine dehydrogenase
LKQRDEERIMQLVYFEVDASDSDVRGGEPMFIGDECTGVTTSGAYGHFVQKSLGFGYVEPQYAAPGTELTIGLLGDRRKARVIAEPVHDPANERLRA